MDIGSATSALRGVTTPAVAGAVQPVPVTLQGAQPKAGGTYHKPLVIYSLRTGKSPSLIGKSTISMGHFQ